MELRACLFAHEWVLEQGRGIGVQRVQVVTDSNYVHENYNRAIRWSGSDWCSAYGRKVGNVDLWKALLRLRRKISGRPRVETVKVDRRSSQIAKAVDNGAKLAARHPTYTDDGFKPGKIGRTRNRDRRAARRYPAAGESLIILVYKMEVVSRGTQNIRFQTYSEDKRDFFEKFSAQADDVIANSLHRGNVFLVRLNDIPQNPRILEILAAMDKSELIGEPAGTVSEED